MPNYTILQVKPKGDMSTKMIDRKTMLDVGKEIPIYPDPVYRPTPKPVKTSISDVPGSLSDIHLELNTDFEDNSPFQEGMLSEMYQRPYKSYFQEPQVLEGLINMGRLLQKVLPMLPDKSICRFAYFIWAHQTCDSVQWCILYHLRVIFCMYLISSLFHV